MRYLVGDSIAIKVNNKNNCRQRTGYQQRSWEGQVLTQEYIYIYIYIQGKKRASEREGKEKKKRKKRTRNIGPIVAHISGPFGLFGRHFIWFETVVDMHIELLLGPSI